MNSALTAGILHCFRLLQERLQCQKDQVFWPLPTLTSEITANINDQWWRPTDKLCQTELLTNNKNPILLSGLNVISSYITVSLIRHFTPRQRPLANASLLVMCTLFLVYTVRANSRLRIRTYEGPVEETWVISQMFDHLRAFTPLSGVTGGGSVSPMLSLFCLLRSILQSGRPWPLVCVWAPQTPVVLALLVKMKQVGFLLIRPSINRAVNIYLESYLYMVLFHSIQSIDMMDFCI